MNIKRKLRENTAIIVAVVVSGLLVTVTGANSLYKRSEAKHQSQTEIVRRFLESHPLDSNRDTPQAMLLSAMLINQRLKEITAELQEIKKLLKSRRYTLGDIGR